MAKSDRHKKLRRREKAKTQLTGVKKLGRAQNIIEPTFCAKKILIREQLHNPEDGEPIQSNRNRSLKDVLQSLSHHNTNIKKDGINGLREIIASQPEALYSNLDKILEKIGSLTSDNEGSIRRENQQLAEVIFAQLTEDQMKPFWGLLLTYIRCTLTNLSPAVRHACLPFVSLLLTFFPNLVSSSLHVLLPNVLGLISSVGKTTGPVAEGKVNSQLKLEISVKQDNSKERVKVLRFLASCLDLYNSKFEVTRGNPSETGPKNKITIVDSPEHISDNVGHVGLYYPTGYQETQAEPPFRGAKNAVGRSLGVESNAIGGSPAINYLHSDVTGVGNYSVGSVGDPLSDKEFWPHFVESCLPLLNQTWLEVRPLLKDGKKDNYLTTGLGERSRGLCNLPSPVVEILECIVSVMTRLILGGNVLNSDSWSTTSMSILPESDSQGNIQLRRLRKNQGQDLKKYFIQWLPFSSVQDSQRKVLTLINLKLFHIGAQLRIIDTEVYENLNQYVQALMKLNALDSSQISTVLEILPLIRISTVDALTSRVLLYAVKSGYFDSVNSFLLRTLQIRPVTTGGLILESINWEQIVSSILDTKTTFTTPLLNILTLIGLRRLVDLRPVLRRHSGDLRVYLIEEESNERWDTVIRLLQYADGMALLTDSNYFGLPVPLEIKETAKVLTFAC